MAQNCSLKIYQCKECNYSSNKNFNLIRHQYAKHKYKYQGYMQINTNGQNVIPIGQNVIPIGQNVIPSEQNVISEFSCKKCSKIYKTKKNLLIHESKCNGVDDLTCPRCMASFTTRQNKSRHIIKNNCKPRSIMHARKPNPNFNNINTKT